MGVLGTLLPLTNVSQLHDESPERDSRRPGGRLTWQGHRGTAAGNRSSTELKKTLEMSGYRRMLATAHYCSIRVNIAIETK